jgi:hypothetical protein
MVIIEHHNSTCDCIGNIFEFFCLKNHEGKKKSYTLKFPDIVQIQVC